MLTIITEYHRIAQNSTEQHRTRSHLVQCSVSLSLPRARGRYSFFSASLFLRRSVYQGSGDGRLPHVLHRHLSNRTSAPYLGSVSTSGFSSRSLLHRSLFHHKLPFLPLNDHLQCSSCSAGHGLTQRPGAIESGNARGGGGGSGNGRGSGNRSGEGRGGGSGNGRGSGNGVFLLLPTPTIFHDMLQCVANTLGARDPVSRADVSSGDAIAAHLQVESEGPKPIQFATGIAAGPIRAWRVECHNGYRTGHRHEVVQSVLDDGPAFGSHMLQWFSDLDSVRDFDL